MRRNNYCIIQNILFVVLWGFVFITEGSNLGFPCGTTSADMTF